MTDRDGTSVKCIPPSDLWLCNSHGEQPRRGYSSDVLALKSKASARPKGGCR